MFLTDKLINRTLTLIRHAPITPKGQLFGQVDADITLPLPSDIERISPQITTATSIYSSPAKRCLKSCATILPHAKISRQIVDFWEQSFGDWEGKSYSEIPDLGPMVGDELVNFRPPNGESFSDVCARVIPALTQLLNQDGGDHIVIFAHAGVIRAILAHAFGNKEAALKCEIDTLSLTQFRILPDGELTITTVNSCR